MYTTLVLKKETKEKLAKLGTLSSTYDSVLNELIDHIQNCRLVEKKEN